MTGRKMPTPFFFRKFNLRAQVTLSVIVPLVFIIGGFTAIQFFRQREAMFDNLNFLATQTGLTIENSLQQAMLSRNQSDLQHILDSISKNENLRIVYLLDTSGRVVFAPGGIGVGLRLDNRDPTCRTCHDLPPAERTRSIVVTLPGDQRVFRSMIPIENAPECQDCHSPDQRIIGVLLTDISMESLEAPLAEDMWEQILWGVAALLVTVIVANLAINHFVLRRLKRLAGGIVNVGRGQLPSPLSDYRQDEIGQLSEAFDAMVRQVEARDVENNRLSESLQRQSTQRGELLKRLISAQEDEHKRVARELHDELGQSLAGLSLRIEVLRRLFASNPEQAITVLDQVQKTINETYEQMHDLILTLRPPALDNMGLVSALRAHARRLFSGSEIVFELDSSQFTGRLPPELETVLYRVFQEALSNVIRHAEASRVCITMARNNGCFEGELVDNGRGFNPNAVLVGENGLQKLGLIGMQERVAQYNGRLEIISHPGSGTRIRVIIPSEEISCD